MELFVFSATDKEITDENDTFSESVIIILQRGF